MRALLLASVSLILTSPLFAQEENGVSLTIRFADGTSRFRVGEIIPLELSFRATVPSEYDLEMRNYDRSGRLNMEQFHVAPPGRDPLTRYFSDGAWMMGGLGGSKELTSDPQTVHEELNEWVALDHPGRYTVYVTSGRVSRRTGDKSAPFEVKSNSLEFEVVAAEHSWQQQTLSSAIMTLRGESSTREEKTAALRTLRFLDSPESLKELVRLLGTDSGVGPNSALGLAGSRYQSLVVRELEDQMNAPEIGLTGNYLYILAKLKSQLENGLLPPYPKTDKEAQKTWTEQRQARDKKLAELQDGLYDKAGALVRSKQGTARAETVQTLLQRPSREAGDVRPLAGLPSEEVAAAFLNLSQDQQWGLLMSFWERLKDPAMIAPLKKVAEEPNMSHQMLRDLVLRCLYDLDPGESAPIFLQEIRHPHIDNGMFTVKGETLGLLPNETLPQFDEMLAARVEQKESRTKDLDAQLIGRYSTKAILQRVKSAYESGAGRDCATEDGFVVYFLRMDPDYGVKRLAQAASFCMTNALPAVIRMHRWSEVEPGIIAHLNCSDLNRARQAAETLAKYGSTQAEKALWERLRKFHEQWSERPMRPGMRSDANEAVGFQYGLVEAIGKAQAWLLTNEKITELENLTLGQEQDNVKQWHWSAPVNLNVSFFGGKIMASISQYSATDLTSLKAKLAQYPSGTKFWLNISGSPERAAPVRAAITDIAAEHGFEVAQPEPVN